MSGDVQPRKRKDKKKKKDDLGIEEPRGTAAALGEGDIFMHSQNEHGTGGHWCAKVIFFSLLAVLITLIGLIILENRGLTDLDANSVESRYSGVLEGWLEDAGDDDHHDEHTLELKHHDDEDEDDDHDHGDELDHDEDLDNDDEHDEHDEDEDDEEGEHDENDDDNDDETQEDENEHDEFNQKENENSEEANDDDDENEDSEEQNLEPAEDDEDIVEERRYRKFYQSSENRLNDDDDDEEDDDLQKGGENNGEDNAQEEDDDDDDNDDDNQLNDADDDDQDIFDKDDDDDDQRELNTKNEDDDDDSQENENSNENDANEAQDNEDEEEHEEPEDDSVEVEHIEEEVFDDDVSSDPAPVSRQIREADDSREVSKESPRVYDAIDDDVELLEPDELDDDLPDLLPIPSSKAKPLVEVEESPSTETPQDTLAEEEEYERQQEQLRREKEQASQGMWLKLLVGGALLVATQAVLRRATAPRETDNEVDTSREETPLSDRRMTLIAEPVPQPVVTPKVQEAPRPVIKEAPIVFTPPAQESEDVEEEEEVGVEEEPTVADNVDKELYSDEEEVEDEEEEIEPPKSVPLKVAQSVKEAPKSTAPIKETPKPPVDKQTPAAEKEPMPEEEEYEDDDVEIIEDEELGEELEDEEISDVDDAELLNRLEAKYGRLPEPHRPGTQKDGGNSIEEQWPGEPSDSYWRDELDRAEQDLRQGEFTRALERASAAPLKPSGRARYIVAKALDMSAEAKRDNALLTKAIAAYLELMKMYDRLSDEKLLLVTDRAINRIMFRGNYMGAEPVYRLLIRRFPDVVTYRNNLTVSFLMANRVDLAEEVIKETLSRWPEDRVALAHHGFILKTRHNKLEEAVQAFTKALEGDKGPANEARFYYHLGDSLLLLGRAEEALEVHKRGAKLGHFLSPSQRSLYNVNRLKSKPWWNVEETPYAGLARTLEQSWKEILKEGLAAQELYEKEKEGLMERGEWTQLDLFVRGKEVSGRCARAPATCAAVRTMSARGCSRGQVKFSALRAGTHVRAHVGPTNCRLRMHLALANTRRTYIRVDKEIRQWEVGKVLMFDDSFEHEVWHNGTGTRLVLIVDVWHPDLTDEEKLSLPAI